MVGAKKINICGVASCLSYFYAFFKLIYEKVADAEQLATCSLDSPQCVLPQKKKSHYKRSQ